MPIGRIIGAVTAAALLGVSAHSGFACHRKNRELKEWQVARPISASIDLSVPGETRTPFVQTCASSHGELVLLDLSPPIHPAKVAERVLEDLDATIVVSDESGNEVLRERIQGGTVQHWGDNHPILLARFHPFAVGNYTATINVESGDAALSNREQTIYAEYQSCGLEGFPALIAGAISFLTLIPGLVILFIVIRGFVKFGWSTPPRAANERLNRSGRAVAGCS